MHATAPIKTPAAEIVHSTNEGPVLPALRLTDVLDLVPIGKSTLYERIAEGRFPRPFKNGKISLWRSEDVAGWFADPSNLLDHVEYRRSQARNRSVVFKGAAVWIEQLERLTEALILAVLVDHYERIEAETRVTRYDREAAEAIQGRLQELRGGAGARIDALAWWSPPRRAIGGQHQGGQSPSQLVQKQPSQEKGE